MQLTGEFLEVEVVTALKQMAPMKVPGPDGMPPLFYQHFWPFIEGNVTQSVLSWLNWYVTSTSKPHFYHPYSQEKKSKACV